MDVIERAYSAPLRRAGSLACASRATRSNGLSRQSTGKQSDEPVGRPLQNGVPLSAQVRIRYNKEKDRHSYETLRGSWGTPLRGLLMLSQTIVKSRSYGAESVRESQLNPVAQLAQHRQRAITLACLLSFVKPIVASVVMFHTLVNDVEDNLQNLMAISHSGFLPLCLLAVFGSSWQPKGIVVRQPGSDFVIRTRDLYSANRGAGTGTDRFLRGLLALDDVVLCPSLHTSHLQPFAGGMQPSFIQRGATRCMDDSCEIHKH